MRQELAAHLQAVAAQLRPGSVLLVLQAFSQYDLHVPRLVAALADASEAHLPNLT